MRHISIGACVVLTLAVLMPAHSADEYRLTGCSVHEATINLGFTTESRAVRRMSIGPRGVTLGGDVKGFTTLESVKQFRFTTSGVLVYEPKHGPEVAFGPIDPECRMKFQQIVTPLASIKEGDG